MRQKPKTFPNFPEDKPCPVCGTTVNGECLLVPIDNTYEGNITEAAVVHLWCALATHYHKDMGLLYTRGDPESLNDNTPTDSQTD